MHTRVHRRGTRELENKRQRSHSHSERRVEEECSADWGDSSPKDVSPSSEASPEPLRIRLVPASATRNRSSPPQLRGFEEPAEPSHSRRWQPAVVAAAACTIADQSAQSWRWRWQLAQSPINRRSRGGGSLHNRRSRGGGSDRMRIHHRRSRGREGGIHGDECISRPTASLTSCSALPTFPILRTWLASWSGSPGRRFTAMLFCVRGPPPQLRSVSGSAFEGALHSTTQCTNPRTLSLSHLVFP